MRTWEYNIHRYELCNRTEKMINKEILMKKDGISTAAKGLIVGGTMLVPGVSGGSMAMILGIYDRLVSSVSSFTKQKKESFFFNCFYFCSFGRYDPFCEPAACPDRSVYETHDVFLSGNSGRRNTHDVSKGPGTGIFLETSRLCYRGILAVMLVSLFPAEAFSSGAGGTGVLVLASAGFVAAIALILPGISISYLLLMLGIYQDTMKAISTFDLGFLTPMGIDCCLELS